MNPKKLFQLVIVVLLFTAPALSQTPAAAPATDEQRQAAKRLILAQSIHASPKDTFEMIGVPRAERLIFTTDPSLQERR